MACLDVFVLCYSYCILFEEITTTIVIIISILANIAIARAIQKLSFFGVVPVCSTRI